LIIKGAQGKQFRNRYLHCGLLKDEFHRRRQQSSMAVDRNNSKGGTKERKRTGMAKEMKNN